jgi:hypothetical protein
MLLPSQQKRMVWLSIVDTPNTTKNKSVIYLMIVYRQEHGHEHEQQNKKKYTYERTWDPHAGSIAHPSTRVTRTVGPRASTRTT